MRPALLCFTISCAAAWACSVRDDVIAEIGKVPMEESTPMGGAGGEGGSGGESGETSTVPRGRVRIADGTVVTDRGTPLRGAALPVDVGWELEGPDFVREIAEQSGLNVLHVFAENWQHSPGEMAPAVDALVELAGENELYVALARGGGPDGPDHPGNGWFDLDQVLAFWDFYAPRYADETHVFYEIQNNPEISCAAPASETIELQAQALASIRAVAPDTHVGLLSLSGVPPESALLSALSDLESITNFENESIFIHANESCEPLSSLAALRTADGVSGVPILFSQVAIDGWEATLGILEEGQASWFQHNWFAFEGELVDFRAQLSAAGLTWCPDQGDFPMDAVTCGSP